jgi:dTDP-4-dehydrorhamnose 3,5-epimerase
VRELAIQGAWLYTPQVHQDSRGSMVEMFAVAEIARHVGTEMRVAQINCPITRRGGVRGVHFTAVPPGQAKYVTCTAGSVLDVVVDVRLGSPTFGRAESVVLDDRRRSAVYLAEGLGHAFMALSEQATVVYLCSTPYAPERERGIDPMDPALGIDWPADIVPILSDRDAAAPSLAQAQALGLLPDYHLSRMPQRRLRS